MSEKFEFPKLYTEFAKYYDRLENQYRDYPRESQWIADLLIERQCRDVIDLSCGTGNHLAILRKIMPQVNLIGMDASREMILLAEKKMEKVPLIMSDFLHFPFRKGTFDAALCMYWSLAGLNESLVRNLFAQASYILKPGGTFVFDTESAEGIKENLLNAPFIDGFFNDPEENIAVIRANFSTKVEPDLVDWRAYYLLETDGVSELKTDRMNLRFYSRNKLESYLEESGFKVSKIFSGPGVDYFEKSPSLYFIAEKV
jgi:SAM-dependent methyltransferase